MPLPKAFPFLEQYNFSILLTLCPSLGVPPSHAGFVVLCFLSPPAQLLLGCPVSLPVSSHPPLLLWSTTKRNSGVFLEMKNVNNLMGLQNRVLEIQHECQGLFLGSAPGPCSPVGLRWPRCGCGTALHSLLCDRQLPACLTSGCSTHTELVQTQP